MLLVAATLLVAAPLFVAAHNGWSHNERQVAAIFGKSTEDQRTSERAYFVYEGKDHSMGSAFAATVGV